MRILSRAFRLLLHPAAEWRSIAAEPATVSEFLGYATVLAAIPAIAGFIGYSVVGMSLGIHAARLRMPIGPGIERAVVVYVLWVVGVYVAALLVRAIAPRFEGRSDLVTGLKVAVHAPTAVWIAGIFRTDPTDRHSDATGAVQRLHAGDRAPDRHRLPAGRERLG